MDAHYGLLLKKSWRDFKNNLIIFLPILFGILFVIGLLILVGLEIFIFAMLGVRSGGDWTPGLFVLAAIIGLIDLVLLILLGGAIEGMNIGLLNSIVSKKKATTKDMWSGMRRFTFPFIRYQLLMLAAYLVPVIVVAGLVLLALLASKVFAIVIGVIFVGIYILYFIALSLLIAIGLLFFLPMLSKGENSSVVQLVKQCLKYAKDNLSHVFFTWLIIFAINLVLGIPYNFTNFGLRFSSLMSTPVLITLIALFVLFFIASMIIGLWLRIFLFNAYFNAELKKL